MRQVLSVIAALSAALFAGAAFYVNLAEHPARLELDTRSAAAQWAPSYKRATWLQAPLAVVSFASGCAVWLMGSQIGWVVAAVLIGAVAVHPPWHHADESQTSHARPRPRLRGNARPVGTLGQVARGANSAQPWVGRALLVVAGRGLTDSVGESISQPRSALTPP